MFGLRKKTQQHRVAGTQKSSSLLVPQVSTFHTRRMPVNADFADGNLYFYIIYLPRQARVPASRDKMHVISLPRGKGQQFDYTAQKKDL